MSIIRISLGCDTPRCCSHCNLDVTTAEAAREFAADRFGWSVNPGGGDECGPCTRGDKPHPNPSARDLHCRYCLAKPGEPCKTRSWGHEIKGLHAARIKAAW